MSVAVQLLKCYYNLVFKLKDLLLQICDVTIDLEREDDPECYTSLLRSSFVGLDALDAFPRQNFKSSQVISGLNEVIDRVQTKLFERAKGRPVNVLTMGYRRADQRGELGRPNMLRPGISNFFPNTNITALQTLEWRILLSRIGEDALYYLLLETSIFLALPNDSFCQTTGTPIYELTTHEPLRFDIYDNHGIKRAHKVDPTEVGPSKRLKLTAADITFARHRILYGRPIMGKDPQHGNTTMVVGLPPDHVLNRLAPGPVSLTSTNEIPSRENIVGRDVRHVLKHIFPRQFGLKSVFDASRDRSKVTDIRIDMDFEISVRRFTPSLKKKRCLVEGLPIVARECQDPTAFEVDYSPCRKAYQTALVLQVSQYPFHNMFLKGITFMSQVVCIILRYIKVKKAKLKQHASLNNTTILEIMSETYNNQGIITQQDHDLLDQSYSSPALKQNLALARKEPKIKPRYAEFTCSHYEVFKYIQKVTLTVIPFEFWGCKANFNNTMRHVKSFINGRRLETFNLHAVLQGFSTQECEWLLPLNPCALHQRPSVTDAQKRRELIEEFLYWYFNSFLIPLIKTSFYVTDSGYLRQRILYFRMDDWTTLCRPLLRNLTEGTFEKIDSAEAEKLLRYKKLGFSFVRLLPKETGVRPIVNLRRKFKNQTNRPEFIGASVFNRNEIYGKLKHFKLQVMDKYQSIPKLYFVKLDVKACFDTIDQNKLIDILLEILTEDYYMIHRSTRVMPVSGKVQRTFMKKALPYDQHPHFILYATKLANMLKHAIMVDQIGADYYRQVVGIPQGSALSTILCAFFYGDLERRQYNFTTDPDCKLLCRLVDDYLFITTSLEKAEHFLLMMSQGHPEYGCFITPEKTLLNFDSNLHIMNTISVVDFPWCGLLIDMKNLSIRGDYSRYNGHIGDTLTIDRRRHPWAAFEHKMLQTARLKSHALFWDAALNDYKVVNLNIYENFLLVGMKMSAYIRGWKIDISKEDVVKALANIVLKIIRFTYRSIKGKASGVVATTNNAVCDVSEDLTTWLGLGAFRRVLEAKKRCTFITLISILDSYARHWKYAHFARQWGEMTKEADKMIKRIQF
ncbi:hypothetical protein Clacol_002902 [Clathrus columnatus]|uniref:Telomerase reverse transcriptase n=1 Tax=Clathrus columnatus TaxID=1419009 RepID=A0AAV5A7R6_9AGAM|nr:hypothetical protein Clacol_002902 [Clathrus columnatus]